MSRLAAHIGEHATDLAERPWGHWNADPLIAAALTLLVLGYAVAAQRLPASARGAAFSADRVLAFALGWLALAAALLSPVDPAGAALLSAHMAQHVLLAALAAPLLAHGLPPARMPLRQCSVMPRDRRSHRSKRRTR